MTDTTTESEFSHRLPEGADDTKKNKFAQYCLDSYHVHPTWTGDTLSEYFAEDFQKFSIEDFSALPNSLRRELQDYLLEKDVYVRKGRSIQISNALYELVNNPASVPSQRSVSFAPDITTVSLQDNDGNNPTQERTSNQNAERHGYNTTSNSYTSIVIQRTLIVFTELIVVVLTALMVHTRMI